MSWKTASGVKFSVPINLHWAELSSSAEHMLCILLYITTGVDCGYFSRAINYPAFRTVLRFGLQEWKGQNVPRGHADLSSCPINLNLPHGVELLQYEAIEELHKHGLVEITGGVANAIKKLLVLELRGVNITDERVPVETERVSVVGGIRVADCRLIPKEEIPRATFSLIIALLFASVNINVVTGETIRERVSLALTIVDQLQRQVAQHPDDHIAKRFACATLLILARVFCHLYQYNEAQTVAKVLEDLSENNCEKWEARIIGHLAHGWETSDWSDVQEKLLETFKLLENDRATRSIQHRMFLDLITLCHWKARYGQMKVPETVINMVIERIQEAQSGNSNQSLDEAQI
jgi:hypothetical protein